MITDGESEIRWEKDESRCLYVPTKMGLSAYTALRCISIAHKLCPEQELRSALLWNRPVCRTLSVLLFELTHLHVIGYCPPHGSNPGEVQLFPAAAWVFGCGLAWGRGDRKLRNGLCHYRRTGRCGSRKLRACRVDHGSPAPPVSKELKRRWSYFIRKVYETDPLVCAKCQEKMRIIRAIDHPES